MNFMKSAKEAAEAGVSLEILYQLVEQAAEEGAMRSLARLGLHDEEAGADIGELRGLLEVWRDTKKTARRTMVRWLITLLLSSFAIGLAVKMKFLELGQ